MTFDKIPAQVIHAPFCNHCNVPLTPTLMEVTGMGAPTRVWTINWHCINQHNHGFSQIRRVSE